MSVVKLENFGGMIPAQDDRLLPDGMSALSRNTWTYSGAVRGINIPQFLYQLNLSTTRRVYRIPKDFYDKQHLAEAYWLEFSDPDTDVIHAPIVNDQFDRYYWCSPSQSPRYDIFANFSAGAFYDGSGGYLLGIPQPVSAPSVSFTGGVSTLMSNRAYVYTRVSAYQEEGPPSPPSDVLSGPTDATWTITMPALGSEGSGRNLAYTNIYRTITSSAGVATYFFVTQLPIGVTTYHDTAEDDVVSLNDQLVSASWYPPPDDLIGMRAMPNGIIAGFRVDEIWFCEAYRPHAWPSEYTLSVENPIVGFGVLGQTVIVLTTGHPYAVQGVTPGSMSLTKIMNIEPCLSRGSIVSTPEGVYYASPNGLMLVNGSGISNMSMSMFTKDKWLGMIDMTRIRATRVGTAYYAFGHVIDATGVFEPETFQPGTFEGVDFTTARDGFILDLLSQRVSVTLLDAPDPTINIMTDEWSGEPFIIRNGQVLWLNIDDTAPRDDYEWRSKVLQAPVRKNFNAMRVWWNNDSFLPIPPMPPRHGGQYPNNVPLDLADDMMAVIRVFADDNEILDVELVQQGQLIRLPAGFKAAFWQVVIFGRVTVWSVEMATTVKELQSV